MKMFRRSVRTIHYLLISIFLAVMPVLGMVHHTAAAAGAVAWPVDVANGPWRITNGYYGDGSDHGCKNNQGQTNLTCATGYQLYGLDIARSDSPDLTAGTPIMSPANGRIAHHWPASNAGDCLIIAVDGYPLSAVDSFSTRRISLCHIVIGSQARDGATIQQGATQLGTIASWPGNQHLHFSIYDLDAYKSDSSENTSYRTPVPFNGDMQIAGCGPYNPNGSLNWASKTYTGTAQFTGNAITCPSGSGKPGGWWLGPTPNDGTSALNTPLALPVNVHGEDKTGSGLKQIDISWQAEGTNQWSKQTQWLGLSSSTSSDFSYNIPAPIGGWPSSIIISFDVYSNDGQAKLAPQGMRRICRTDVTCSPVTTNPPGGGSSTCTTPPSTSSDVSGSITGSHGWWRSPVTVILSANSPCGQAGTKTYYSINAGSQNTYTGPIAFNQEGIYNISYYSVDGLGNIEAKRMALVQIDWTPPITAGTASGPRDTNGIFRDNVTVGLNATDNLSGVDYEQYSLDGGMAWTSLNGANNSFVLSGNGVSRVLYRSTDIAGNNEQNRDSGPIIINKYVIFSNGTGQSLNLFAGTGLTISGDIFSNGSAGIQYNTGSTIGSTFRTVGSTNTISGNTNTTIPAISTGGSTVPMLSYPLSLYKSLATVYFPSDLKLNSVSSSLKSIIYVDGNVDMTDVNLSGPLSIIATGTISDRTTDSTYQTNDPYNGVLLYAGKDVNVKSTGNRNLGLMYAPNGTINVSATNLNLKGSLVGNQVSINGATTFNLSYNPAFSSSTYTLPLTAMGLVIPTTTPPPLPSTSSLYMPSVGSTVSSSGVTFAWGTGSGAVGYQLQVSKSSTFSTLDYNVCQLSKAQRMDLSPAATYYWRVRAINEAGMSNWSTASTFRTQ